MSDFRIISDKEVRDQITMATAISIMRDAFVQISKRTAQVPIRNALDASNNNGRVLFMPAYSPGFHLFGLKMVSVFPENAQNNIPSIQGKMLVMDDQTGTPLGLIDAEYLTSLRTGAASGLATDLLALPEARVLAIFGTGAQSKTQVNAVLEVRKIKKVIVFGSSKDKSKQFCQYIEREHQVSSLVGDLKSLKEADVICTATTSTHPLFSSHQIKSGVHINGVGSYKPTIREIPSEVVQKSLLVVDHRESALSEAGDIIIPIQEGVIDAQSIHAELGEILIGAKKGRLNSEQITMFKSVGNAVQDLAMAAHLLQ
jgi:ornithine cyclodeaminase/alanine dehydrogenase-like protein (mu-crystallin family)